MKLEILPGEFCVLKMGSISLPKSGPYFLSVTGKEISLVCQSDARPPEAEKVEPGWRALRVAGSLDFALTGVMAGLCGALAAAEISLFSLSTFDTDYLLVKKALLTKAIQCLRKEGYEVPTEEADL